MRWYAKLDLFFIVLLIAFSIIVFVLKRDSPYWWTGFFPLGLLPLVISDYRKDRKSISS